VASRRSDKCQEIHASILPGSAGTRGVPSHRKFRKHCFYCSRRLPEPHSDKAREQHSELHAQSC